jgi:hypothetical protein
MSFLTKLRPLLLAALVIVVAAVVIWKWFPQFPVSYVLVCGIGVLVGVGELVSRYRDAPEQAVRTVPAAIYIALNAAAAIAAFFLVLAYDVVPGRGDAPAISRVMLAGFGAMAFFRTSIFTTRVGDQDVSIGPVAFLQIVLHAADRAVDRLRADARASAVSQCMAGVSFEAAQEALPAFCMALMQNVSPDEQQKASEAIQLLEASAMDDTTKAKNLGLILMNVVGEKVLLTAVSNLAAQIKRVVSVTIEPPRGTVQVGEAFPLAAKCRDSAGSVIVGRGVAWTSADVNVATVGVDGRVRGVAAGRTRIAAAADDAVDTIAVEVTGR